MMIRRLLTALCLFAPLTLVAAERAPAIPDYQAEQVAPNTYVIHGPLGYPDAKNKGFMNNPAFVVTPVGAIVIDPGSSLQVGEMVLRQIEKVTGRKRIIAVLNTHVHGDHWLGNHAMREASPKVPIYGHPRMIAAIEAGAGESWLDLMERSTEGATRGTEAIGPNHAVRDGEELLLAGFTFRIHHVGGAHSGSDVMIEVVEEGVLFLGDNVNNRRIVRMDDGTFSGNIAAAVRAMIIPAKVFVPGHGQTAGREIVDAYRRYLSGLYAEVERLYEQGLAPFEMKDQVAAKLAGFKDWSGFDEELGKHISLAYLEIEAKAFQ